MTDQRSSTATYRPSIDYGARAAGTKPDGPAPSFQETVGASFKLGQADQMGDDEQAVINAYGPLVTELNRRGSPVSRYVFAARGNGNPVNEYAVWRDIAVARARDPKAFPDLPSDRKAFRAKVGADYREGLVRAADVSDRGGLLGNLVGGFGAAMTDPINVGTAFVTGGGGTLARRIVAEAVANAGTELVQQPFVAMQRAKTGRTLSAGEAALNVTSAGLLGGALPAAGALGRRVATPAGEAVKRLIQGIGADRLTPEQRGAARTLQAEDDALQSNPYGPGGAEHHLRRLDAEKSAMAGYRTVANAPDRAISTETVAEGRVRDRASVANLTPDNIIRFVMRDLEGGSAVVRYSDADGGTTKFGIAAKFHPGVDIANLTEEGAAAISREKYWSRSFDQVDPRVAAVMYDAKFLGGNRAFEKVSRASREGSWENALGTYRAHLNMIADTVPGKERYRNGWMKRLDKLERFITRNGGDGDMPVLRRADFDPDEEGAGAWRAAQEEVEAAERALDAADAELAQASGPPRLLDGEDDIPFDLDDPRARTADGEQRDPFAYLDDEPAEPVGRAVEELGEVSSPSAEDMVVLREASERGYNPSARQAYVDATFDRSVLLSDLLQDDGQRTFITQRTPEEARSALGPERAEILTKAARDMEAGTITPEEAMAQVSERDLAVLTRQREQSDNAVVADRLQEQVDQGVPGARQALDRLLERQRNPIRAQRIAEQAATRERVIADQFADGPEPQAPPSTLDGYDSAGDVGAKDALDSLEHDLRMLADAEPGAIALDENGDVVSVADLLAGWDIESREIAAIEGCL